MTAPRFFARAAEFRRWLEKNHAKAAELLVGFHKVGSGHPSMTWPESVDEALCFGWIDGVRTRIDDASYTIRFTPRRPGSHWSLVNVGRMQALVDAGRVREAGLRAFAARRDDRTGNASYERRPEGLEPPYRERLQAHAAACAFFDAQAASYRRAACNWVHGARQEATRLKRLDRLLEVSARGERLPQFTRWAPGGRTTAAVKAPAAARKTPVKAAARKAPARKAQAHKAQTREAPPRKAATKR